MKIKTKKYQLTLLILFVSINFLFGINVRVIESINWEKDGELTKEKTHTARLISKAIEHDRYLVFKQLTNSDWKEYRKTLIVGSTLKKEEKDKVAFGVELEQAGEERYFFRRCYFDYSDEKFEPLFEIQIWIQEDEFLPDSVRVIEGTSIPKNIADEIAKGMGEKYPPIIGFHRNSKIIVDWENGEVVFSDGKGLLISNPELGDKISLKINGFIEQNPDDLPEEYWSLNIVFLQIAHSDTTILTEKINRLSNLRELVVSARITSFDNLDFCQLKNLKKVFIDCNKCEIEPSFFNCIEDLDSFEFQSSGRLKIKK